MARGCLGVADAAAVGAAEPPLLSLLHGEVVVVVLDDLDGVATTPMRYA